MEIVKEFILPLIKTFVYVLFFGGFLVILLRYCFIKYNKSWKWFLKYKISRNKYEEKDLKWIMDCVERDYETFKIKKMLLLSGFSQDKINEIIWIYKQVYFQMKGGVNYGRKFKGCDRKVESTAEFPEFNSKSSSKSSSK